MLSLTRRLVVAVAAASLLVTPVAVTSSASATTASVPSASALAVAPSYTSKENRFYKAMLADDPTWASVGKKDLVKAARLECKFLRKGGTAEELIGMLVEAEFNEDEIASLVVNAVWYVCPDQKSKLPE